MMQRFTADGLTTYTLEMETLCTGGLEQLMFKSPKHRYRPPHTDTAAEYTIQAVIIISHACISRHTPPAWLPDWNIPAGTGGAVMGG
jgi:hypothetical protein